jgi:hypothetical protein
VLWVYVPKLVANPHDAGRWTSGAELLALCGAARVLAGAHTTIRLGRFLFALPLLVFGIQHSMYARYVATLVPSWIPGHLFWAYFVGVAFIAIRDLVGNYVSALGAGSPSAPSGRRSALRRRVDECIRSAGDERRSLPGSGNLKAGRLIPVGGLRETSPGRRLFPSAVLPSPSVPCLSARRKSRRRPPASRPDLELSQSLEPRRTPRYTKV